MEALRDFEELLESLNSAKADYLIVGSYAVAFHGAPRFTGDIDILIKADAENALRVLHALEHFGFANVGIETSDLSNPDQVIQLGVPPVRIDLITSISGVSWEEAWQSRVASPFGIVPVHFIGRDALVRNKRATGRRKDLADLEALGESS